MRKFLLILVVLFSIVGLTAQTAEAKRFGGGRTFGVQRSANSYQRMATPSMAKQTAASAASKWGNRLAGLALGGLLAYLFFGHGIGTSVLSWLFIGFVVFMIYQYIRQKREVYRPQSANNYQQTNFGQTQGPEYNNYASAQYNAPANFNEEDFIREAKVMFMRLQAASDQRNLADIREFTTPEVFAEIQVGFQEHLANADEQTEVVNLNTQFMGVTDDYPQVASIKFSGLIRENVKDNAAPFTEVWHFQKDLTSSRWIVAGLQQL